MSAKRAGRWSWIRRGLVDLVLPPTCAACRCAIDGARALCPRCEARLPRFAPDSCRSCQERPGIGTAPCAACARLRLPLAACVAATRFAGDAERWVYRFKYPKPGLGGLDPTPFAVVRDLVRDAASRAPGEPPGLVAPVPLHPARLRSRGFNPAQLLARSLARALHAAYDPVALVRLRDTPSQTGLDRRARRANVRGAFGPRRGWQAPSCVWLVDDVVTTGSTLCEAARAARRAGARRVVGICAARTAMLDPAP